MIRHLRRAGLAAIALSVAGCAGEKIAAPTDIVAQDANLAAVLVFAEWCSSCKILDPKLQAVKAADAFPGVSFMTIDYTGRDVDALFAEADKKGVGPAVRTYLADEVKTGWLLLVDLDDNRVVGQVVKSMDEAEIAGAIKATQLAS